MRVTAAMLAAGKKQLERHSSDTGGTYEVTCAADTLVRDIFKAMMAVSTSPKSGDRSTKLSRPYVVGFPPDLVKALRALLPPRAR